MEAKQEIEKQKKYIEKVKKINNNKKLKYNIYTMGCQLNENDSEKLCGDRRHGLWKTNDAKKPIYVYLTHAV